MISGPRVRNDRLAPSGLPRRMTRAASPWWTLLQLIDEVAMHAGHASAML